MGNKVLNPTLGKFLIFLVLAASGNPEFRQSKYIYIFLFVFTIITTFKYIDKIFLKKYAILIFGLTSIFIAQRISLGFTNNLGIINTYIKIFIAGHIIFINKEKFIPRYFEIIYILSLISIIFFTLDFLKILNGIIPPTFTVHYDEIFEGGDRNYYFFYQTRGGGFLRNSGMFWEPGVFSNYIIMCLALILPSFENMNRSNKRKLAVIIVALITTFSTTGYILGAILFLTRYFYLKKLKLKHILIVLLFFIIGISVFNNAPFLREKIQKQNEIALSSRGEMNYTRIGQLLFDIHYIIKHPIIGNGLHEKTRLIDHPFLQSENSGFDVGNGNGFSQFLVSYGIIFPLIFFIIIFKNIYSIYDDKLFSYIFITIFILNLQGEPLMTYPFYWGFIFINVKLHPINIQSKMILKT